MGPSAPPLHPTVPKSVSDAAPLSTDEERSIMRSNKQKEQLAKQRAKRDEKSAARQALMASRPKPNEGFPLLIYKVKRLWQLFLGLFGKKWEFVNPKMTKHDHFVTRVSVLGTLLKRSSMSLGRIVLTVVNAKGGAGKTPLLAYLAAVFATYSNNPTVALDLNQNEGTLHNLYGMLRNQTLTLMQALKMRSELVNWDALTPYMRSHEQTGVRMLASEDIDLNVIEQKEFDELIDGFTKAAHLVAIDTGNGKGYAANKSAVQNARAVVHASLWDKPDTFEGVAGTIRGYLVRGMQEQIYNRSYTVVSGTPRNMPKQKVFEAFEQRIFDVWGLLEKDITDERRAELLISEKAQRERKDQLMKWLGIRYERFYIVPESAHIKEVKVVDVTAETIGFEALIAYLEILVDIYAHANRDPLYDSEALDAVQAELAGIEETFLAWRDENLSSLEGAVPETLEDLDPLGDLGSKSDTSSMERIST